MIINIGYEGGLKLKLANKASPPQQGTPDSVGGELIYVYILFVFKIQIPPHSQQLSPWTARQHFSLLILYIQKCMHSLWQRACQLIVNPKRCKKLKLLVQTVEIKND